MPVEQISQHKLESHPCMPLTGRISPVVSVMIPTTTGPNIELPLSVLCQCCERNIGSLPHLPVTA